MCSFVHDNGNFVYFWRPRHGGIDYAVLAALVTDVVMRDARAFSVRAVLTRVPIVRSRTVN